MAPTYTIRGHGVRLPGSTVGLPACRHLDFDSYPGVGQSRRDHRRGGSHIAEVFLEDRPALREVLGLWKNVRDPDHVPETGPGLLEGRRDIPQTLLGLLEQVFRNSHRLIVEPRRARDEDPLPIDDRPRTAGLSLERRAGADEPTIHLRLLSIPGRRRTGGPGPGRPAPRTPRPPPPALRRRGRRPRGQRPRRARS